MVNRMSSPGTLGILFLSLVERSVTDTKLLFYLTLTLMYGTSASSSASSSATVSKMTYF